MPSAYTPRTPCVGRTGLASDAAMLSVEPKRIWLRMRPSPPGCTAGLMPLKMPMPATSMLRSTVGAVAVHVHADGLEDVDGAAPGREGASAVPRHPRPAAPRR